ncbi:MAG: hypothetical protein A0129_13505 [Limnobacter sp. CACIAM 66H1]|uniref:MbcA/ParS/Xre antitoxin family protein n=1 Tax=Limnobacter sp. CACIAM 66H1 TaxID=1813033 RepID=UPI0007A92608|nr:MbcA/ParS/Xre antitoxin family protein [Limnobacter sp. CACIAM 66H1]KYP10311.1 MAG: hypothetical protein A0129_13505 [Limnobacter sp. CACIAM 66H1]
MHFSQFSELATELGLSQITLLSWTGINKGALNSARRRGAFTGDNSNLLTGIQFMLNTIKAASLSSDAVNFDHGRWLSSWMEEPNPALGYLDPKELLNTYDGQAKVLNLLCAILHGVYQ